MTLPFPWNPLLQWSPLEPRRSPGPSLRRCSWTAFAGPIWDWCWTRVICRLVTLAVSAKEPIPGSHGKDRNHVDMYGYVIPRYGKDISSIWVKMLERKCKRGAILSFILFSWISPKVGEWDSLASVSAIQKGYYQEKANLVVLRLYFLRANWMVA